MTDWNAISAEWAGFLSCNRKNDVFKLPWPANKLFDSIIGAFTM